ncbi:EamA family transporter [Nocardioides baekrokdamisoli]|nr:EamA family transporter [Nocardioides baekrokdamisoli]
MSPRHRLLAALMAVIWGVNFVVIDAGMGDVPPLVFAAIRFLGVAPLALFIPRPRASARAVIGVGLFMFAGQYGFLYLSMAAGLPAGLAALMLQAQVPLTIAFAAIALRERPGVRTLLGVAVAAAGLVVVGIGRGGAISLGAVVLVGFAAITWAIGNVIARGSGAPSGLPLTVWASLVPPVPLAVLALAVSGPSGVAHGLGTFGWAALASTAYTVILSTVAGFTIFNGLLARYSSASVVPWVLVVPPVGMVASAIFLGERPNAAEIIGGVVLIAGAWLALSPPRRKVRFTAPNGEVYSAER